MQVQFSHCVTCAESGTVKVAEPPPEQANGNTAKVERSMTFGGFMLKQTVMLSPCWSVKVPVVLTLAPFLSVTTYVNGAGAAGNETVIAALFEFWNEIHSAPVIVF